MKMRIAMGLLLAGSACAPSLQTAGDTKAPRPADNVVLLNVTNNYNGPVEIYALASSGTVFRMGIVLPGLSSHFVLRQAQIENGPVEFLGQLSGQRLVRSDRLLLVAGNIVDFEIATTLMNSAAIIRP